MTILGSVTDNLIGYENCRYVSHAFANAKGEASISLQNADLRNLCAWDFPSLSWNGFALVPDESLLVQVQAFVPNMPVRSA